MLAKTQELGQLARGGGISKDELLNLIEHLAWGQRRPGCGTGDVTTVFACGLDEQRKDLELVVGVLPGFLKL